MSDRISEKINKEYFDKNSANYDGRFGLSPEADRGRAHFISEHTKNSLSEVRNVLDLGCGTGNLTIALLLEGVAAKSVGLDISPGMLSVAQRKIRNISACSFVVGSALRLPFKDGSFDLCVGDAFLHHILDVGACLAEVNRVLKPGGIATFNEPSRDGYAFFELIIRMILEATDGNDQVLDNYIDFLAYQRKNEGNLKALEAYPLPDKHVFSEKALKQMAKSTGFSEVVLEPAMGSCPKLWQDSFNAVLAAIGATEDMTKKILRAGELVDEIMGEASRLHFCLHNQIFFHKKGKRSRSLQDSGEIVFGAERVTHLYPNDCYQAHLSIYYFASQFCQNRKVLDAGSGAGYGSAYLADHGARHVVGVDISPEAIDFSKYHFQRDNLQFLQGDLQELARAQPCSFDVIFCSSVLEHVKSVKNVLNAFTHLLKPEGIVIAAVPPITNEELRKQELTNPYHVNIWSPKQWYNVLRMYFSDVQMFCHLFEKPGIALNFENAPSETVICEKEFKFEQIPSIDIFYSISTITAIFLLKKPIDESDLPPTDSQITFVDESFTLMPGNNHSTGLNSINSTTQTNVGPLIKGNKICQKFTPRENGLCALSLLVATYCKQVLSVARLSIFDAENNKKLRQIKVNTVGFADNTWQRLDFASIPDSAGKSLLFCIETDGKDEAITLWTNNTISGVCQKNGVDLDEAVCFRCHFEG